MITVLRTHAVTAVLAMVAMGLIVGCTPSSPPVPPPAGAEKSSASKAEPSKSVATPTVTDKPAPTPSGSAKPAATSTGSAVGAAGWQTLFDGKTLTNWKVTPFDDHGKVSVADGQLVFDIGSGTLTGVTWAGGDLPRMNYELSCEATRLNGSDFFCALTFPYNDSSASFVCGGWGGSLCGISSLGGYDAANNETTKTMEFETGRWYLISVKVTPDHIAAWVDTDLMVDCEVNGRPVAVRSEVEASQPLGLAAFMTKAAVRNVKIRRLPE
jgi:hypothetical protein